MTEPTPRRSVRPGPWFGIFGTHATVLLPPSDKERVGGLWALVDDGAGFDEVLDALISGGLRQLPGFVLVSELEAETKVVIRGAARAVFTAAGERVELEGSPGTTWVERTLTDVTAMTLEVDDTVDEAGDGEPLTVGNGLVRVARVEVGTPDEAPQASERQPQADPQREPEPVAEPNPAPATPPVPDPPPAPESSPLPATSAPPVAADAPGGADHDGMTHAGEVDAEADPWSAPGIPGQPPAPPVVARPVARLVISSGETVDVDRAIVVGRAPEARRFPAAQQPRPVTVPSPQQEISSTHVEFRPGTGADHGSAVVTDLGSTNGTVLVQPGLPPEDLQPGIPVQLIPGAIVDLGDGVTIQVLNP